MPTTGRRFSAWLALALAVMALQPASATPAPENLVPVDKDGHFVNNHTDVFAKTGARVARYNESNKCAGGGNFRPPAAHLVPNTASNQQTQDTAGPLS